MPGGPEYPVLGGVEFKIGAVPPLTSQSGAVATPSVTPDFIGSATVVNAPTLNSLGFGVPFISSVTSVHAPAVGVSGSVTISVAGTYVWVCPSGISTIFVECFGGGGGSCDGHGDIATGKGGGGGAYSARFAVPVTPGTSYTFVVGAAGTHGAAPADGGTGGDSTFTGDSGTQVIAKGGGGGIFSGGPGAGGTASGSTGDTGHKFSGGAGAGDQGSGIAGGGGASGNNAATGNSSTSQAGGVGANGGGSGGRGGFSAGGAGVAGSSPGGAGGGGGGFGGAGASGAAGQVHISVGQTFPAFIASDTVVYTPTLLPHQEFAPFISSVTVVYAPVISSLKVLVPFLSSNTHVYEPTLKQTFTGGGVSQVSLEIIGSGNEPDANVSQVTLEILVPWYKGAHVWHKSGQTGG